MPPPGSHQLDQSNLHSVKRAMSLAAGGSISALQPPRLLLGLLAVACIAIGGSLLDAFESSSWQQTIDKPVTDSNAVLLEGMRQVLSDAYVEEDVSEDPREAIAQLRQAMKADLLAYQKTLETAEERLAAEKAYQANEQLFEQMEFCGPFEAAMRSAGQGLSRFVEGVLTIQPQQALLALAYIVYEIPVELWSNDPLITILLALLIGFCFALFGGAIARLDALESGLKLKPTAWDGLEFAWSNVQRLLQAVLLPLAVVAILCGLLAIVGIPFNLPVLDVVGGILYFIAIALSLVSSALLIGYGVLVPMLVGAVGVERADAGEAIQGSWGSAMARPGYYILLLAVGLVCFAVSLAIVDLVVVLALNIAAESWGGIISGGAMRSAGTFTVLDFTFDSLPSTATGTASATGALVSFWEQLLIGLLLGYIFSWVASIGTRLFLGMRLLVDRQSPSVIWMSGTVAGSTVHTSEQPEKRFESEDTFSDGPR
ncbi:MAG: hypothetical protein CMJ57_06895 [Planctomycetaceae bacterium]|nr:hypothetical protein [Planctomycetaceae bacterium]